MNHPNAKDTKYANQNSKYGNQNSKYANQNSKYAQLICVVLSQGNFFLANLRTYLAYNLHAQKCGGV